MIILYGDEDQNELMDMIKNYKGEENMEENRIEKIEKDIAAYKQAIENAEGALEAAERELYRTFSEYDVPNMEVCPE